MSSQVSGLVLLALMLAAQCSGPAAAPQKEEGSVQSPIQMKTNFVAEGDALKISYEVSNGSNEPIFVLDRMWSKRAKAFDANWGYVEIRGNRALVKRVMETKPTKLIVEHPPSPYGRELKPGERLNGEFTLSLPLTAVGAYDFFTKQNAVAENVEVTDVGFVLAWTTPPKDPVPPSMRKVEVDGEILQPFSYYVLEGAQRFLTSEPEKMRLPGVNKRVPER